MPRGPSWTKEDEQVILQAAKEAQEKRIPLSEVWQQLAAKLKRTPGAISIHYYQIVREQPASENTKKATEVIAPAVARAPKRRGRKPKTAQQVAEAEQLGAVEEQKSLVAGEAVTKAAEAQETTAEVTQDDNDEWVPITEEAQAETEGDTGEQTQTAEETAIDEYVTEEADAGVEPMLAIGAKRTIVAEAEQAEVEEEAEVEEIADEDETITDTLTDTFDTTAVYNNNIGYDYIDYNDAIANINRRLHELESAITEVKDPQYLLRAIVTMLQAAANTTLAQQETTSLREQLDTKDKQLSVCMQQLANIRTATKAFKDYFDAYQNLRTPEQMSKYAELLQKIDHLVNSILYS